MDKCFMERFNVQRLLRVGDLDVRGIASNDKALKADDYFEKVEEFLDKSPKIVNDMSFNKDVTQNEEFIGKLTEMKEILSAIGLRELIDEVDRFCEVAKSKSQVMVEQLVPGFMNQFISVYNRVKRAHMNDVEEEGKFSGMTLAEALKKHDYEEANRKPRILAVDDVALLLHMLISVLGEEFEVFALKKGAEVEGFLRHTIPDLFILDLELPDIKGYDLVPIIRSFEEHKDTPIIILTGNATIDRMKVIVSLGVDEFLTKPVDKEVLLEKVRMHINKKKQAP